MNDLQILEYRLRNSENMRREASADSAMIKAEIRHLKGHLPRPEYGEKK